MAPPVSAGSITAGVAASLTDVVGQLAAKYAASGGARVSINAAASNALARQIVEGAPIDLFISADETQMDVVARAGRLGADARVDLLTNELVVIAARDATTRLAAPADLTRGDVQRVAIGQPESVPAGVYARLWLEKIGLWTAIQPKTIPLSNVRAALAAVREGRAEVAIVYATDARAEKNVVTVYRVPAGDAPRIVYPAAVIAGTHEAEARRFLGFLQSAEARAAFQAAGFGIPQ